MIDWHFIGVGILFACGLLLGYLHGRRDGVDSGYVAGYHQGQADTEQQAARELPQLLAGYGVDVTRPMGADVTSAACLQHTSPSAATQRGE